ncbi:SDR family oxidoreductase [uncultured Cohaesibacter sp.]|uniref:SDR family oxidoreductase n=1 Tax=uncultured Cohaesibacter sp. TaxID=1002546 RepID=UPI0029C90239|nr:SDR family oxidoreductase [uncultured Cohaesibacter sp.]
MKDLEGKIVLITGATDGIGKATALALAKRGAYVTIVGRSAQKTAKVLEELESASNNQHLDSIVCDLSRVAEVKRAAEEFKAKHSRLDILINNAGATFRKPVLGPDGYELTFSLNHLAYFQMTHSLLDLIKATPGARIISTASSLQSLGKIDLEKTPKDISQSGLRAYGTSKLANILFTKELQRRLGGADATANCFTPGMVRTSFGGFGSNQGLLLNMVFRLAAPFAKRPEQGADTQIWLATANEARAFKGEFLSNRKTRMPQKQAMDAKLAKELWTRSEEICNEILGR